MLNIFNFLRPQTQAGDKLFSAASGQVVPLESVPDPAFAQRMLGDGVAVQPDSDLITAPADGTISMMYPSMHAFGMVLPNGIELLVHIGVNTVDLKGVGFQRFVNKNAVVKAGDPIIRVDRQLLEKEGYDPVVMLIITEPQDYRCEFASPQTQVTKRSVVVSFHENTAPEQ